LQFEPADLRLHFEASRCLVCEQCIPSCPLEAIALVLEPQ
jgi:formate hydrogenlyase subunit 6/NADH:ubiquinone oxidoreductase subunit I